MICPLLGRCTEKVTYDKYVNICSNIARDAFKECDVWRKLTAEAKTPGEWSRLISVMPAT
ncbi:MAG: hypothetical protein QXH10_09255 [Ignisphaera sp.]|uniref:Uncharacterized protein n=1 Tax=Ligamenvirales sp. TaxID=2832923 RepID=A0AAU6PX59_9VIRU